MVQEDLKLKGITDRLVDSKEETLNKSSNKETRMASSITKLTIKCSTIR